MGRVGFLRVRLWVPSAKRFALGVSLVYPLGERMERC